VPLELVYHAASGQHIDLIR